MWWKLFKQNTSRNQTEADRLLNKNPHVAHWDTTILGHAFDRQKFQKISYKSNTELQEQNRLMHAVVYLKEFYPNTYHSLGLPHCSLWKNGIKVKRAQKEKYSWFSFKWHISDWCVTHNPSHDEVFKGNAKLISSLDCNSLVAVQ